MSGSPWPTVRPRSALSAAVVGVVPALLLGAPALAGSSALPSGCGVRVDVPAGVGQAWLAVTALPGLEPVRVADDGLLTGRGAVDVPLTTDAGRVRVALSLDGVDEPPVDVDVPACAAGDRSATPTATLPPSTPPAATPTVTLGRPAAPRATSPVPATLPLTGTVSAPATLAAPGAGTAALAPLVAPQPGAGTATAPQVAGMPLVAPPPVVAQSAVGPQSASLAAALPAPPAQPDVVIAAPSASTLPPAEAPPAYADLVPAAVLLAGSLGGLVAIARRRWI